MEKFLLKNDELAFISANVSTSDLNSFIISEYARSDDSCDRYDCFFRDVQCPCEGICDGRA